MTEQTVPPESAALLDDLWFSCVSLIGNGVDYLLYVEMLKRQHAELPENARELIAWPAMQGIGRMVWSHTPQPRLNYALAPAVTPQRNAPCSCGSGRKYKHCCLPLEQGMPPLPEMNFLPMLLDCLPQRRWRELAGSRVPVDMVHDAAMQLDEAGLDKDVCTLLEPWFVADADFHARREGLLDALLDAYTGLPRPRKKAQLLDRALAVGDRRIRSAALQRKATMVSDRGDYRAAWQLFAEAQRADPQSPSLSHLEIVLLLGEGRGEEARERAKFWVHRLTAMRDPELAGLIGFMRSVAEQGKGALQQFFLEQDPELAELTELLQSAPPLAAQYTLDPDHETAGPLKPKPALRKALRAWEEVAVAPGHSPWVHGDDDEADIGAWLPVLRAHPQLWNAFETLGTIAAAVRDTGVQAFTDAIARPLLDRAEHLLREVLRANHAEGKRFEWGWLENRPALSLLGDRIAIDGDRPGDAAQLARLEWLVRTLNPHDNQGFRHALVRAYLRAGRGEAALAVCDDYPDDFAAMQYNRALALYATHQSGKALTALQNAVAAYPKPLAWLLKANPKPPKLDAYGVRLGGDDEAWFYRRDTLALWRQLGALNWLRTCAKALGKRG
jgi:tetratricopeptide (TPR) repeat protein